MNLYVGGIHKELKKLLHAAEGQSRHVVVVFLDVRGFSSFAGIAESTDTAEFLKSSYIKILDDYFPDAVFFKPTGDGLLVLFAYRREDLKEVVKTAVERSVRLVEDFPSFADDDDMLNFDVPTKLGIGLARGSATSLSAEEKTLDYSGRPLNLASRLMDLARPAGVVFDDSFGVDLLPEDLQKKFKRDHAYVKGLAESVPIVVYYLDRLTEIPEANKKPLDGFVRFSEKTEKISFEELAERGTFRHLLTKDPARQDSIEVHLRYPKLKSDGSKHPSYHHNATLKAEYRTARGEPYALVDYAPKVRQLRELGVKDGWDVETTVEYSVIPEAGAASG